MEYRGIVVIKERLRFCEDYVLSKDSVLDEMANSYRDKYTDEGLIISNELAVKFARARTIGELKDVLTVNYVTTFEDSVFRAKETYSFLSFVILAGIVPIFVLIFFVNLIIHDNE